MERIPLDIIINNIIPYTYNIQPTFLLEDIKNYSAIKTKIMDDKYDANNVKLEILSYFYCKTFTIHKILNRHFNPNVHNHDYNYIKKYSIHKQFSILFGLLTPNERIIVSNYLIQVIVGMILK
jgi:hypothetical protein